MNRRRVTPARIQQPFSRGPNDRLPEHEPNLRVRPTAPPLRADNPPQQSKIHHYLHAPCKIEVNKTLGEYLTINAKTIIMAEEFNLASTEALLMFLTGECGAWQAAFESALSNEGITSQSIKVVVKFKTGEECGEPMEKCSMLIDNWKFEGAAKGGFAYSESEVVDLNGLPAQGLENPPSLFASHQLVAVNNELYDPSYGVGPIAGPFGVEGPLGMGGEGELIRTEYQNRYIAGFCKKNPDTGKYKCAKAVADNLKLEFK